MMPSRTIRSLLAATLFATASLAQAADWRVDLIIFEDRNNRGGAPGEMAGPARAPESRDAIPLSDTARLSAAGIRMLPESDFGLQTQWNRLNNSQRFNPVMRLSWIQRDPPQRNGPRLRISHGPSFEIGRAMDPGGSRSIQQIEGVIALTLQRFLHLDLDLQWAEAGYGGEPMGFVLQEQRRMRSNTLHHVDSPRFGVITRIVRVGDG
jgi:hypothetical protein